MIPGGASDRTLDKIDYVEQAGQRTDLPEPVRAQIADAVADLAAGGAVQPIYERVRSLIEDDKQQREAELHAMAEDAVARVTATKTRKSAGTKPRPTAAAAGRWPVRAFVLTWQELESWWTHYDPEELVAELTLDQIDAFLATAAGTSEFAARLRAARDRHQTTEDAEDAPTEGDGEGEGGGRPLLRVI